MEELITSQLDNQENNFLCLICGCTVCQSLRPAKGNGCGISKQLIVIFLLKNVLQVPSNQLKKFLQNCGNPESWISLCDECSQLTREARDLHLQIVEITRKLKSHQKLIIEKVKSTSGTLPSQEARSKVNKLKDVDTPKIKVWRETTKFVKNYNYDDLCPDDPILEANKLIKKLEALPLPPAIKIEPEDNHPFLLEDLSPSRPGTPPPNQDDSEWISSPSSSPSPEDFKVSASAPKPKRIRNRHPPIPPSEYTNQCLHCPLKFRFCAQVFSHMHSTHSVSDFPCLHPNCPAILTTIKKYSKHRVKKHLKPPTIKPPKLKIQKEKKSPPAKESQRVMCDLCGGDFASKNNLQQHMKFVHDKSKVYKRYDVSCHLCGLIVKNVNMRKHLLRLHSDEVELPARKVKGQDGPRDPVKLLKCPVVGCKIEYLRKEGLDKHMIRDHGIGGDVGGDLRGDGGGDLTVNFFRYSCSFCGKGFSLKRKLAHHEMVHRNSQLNVKPFKCELCGKGFSTKKYLSYHKYHTHKLAKKFKMVGEKVN